MIDNVTAVFVAYNSAHILPRAIESLPDGMKIMVVDNASRDNTIPMLERDFPGVKLIKSDKNLGFGPGNNLALRQIDTEYALIINPDAFLEEDALLKLIDAHKKYPDAGIVAPIMFDEKGKIYHSFKPNVFKREKHRYQFVLPEGDIGAEYISGAIMLAKTKALQDVGFFDDNIFLFYEDDDLCLKMMDAGYSNLIIPAAKSIHLQGQSSKPAPKIIYLKNLYMTKSRIYMEKKYKGTLAAFFMALKQVLINFGKSFFYSLTLNKPKAFKSFARMMGGLQYFVG